MGKHACVQRDGGPKVGVTKRENGGRKNGGEYIFSDMNYSNVSHIFLFWGPFFNLSYKSLMT
jgi:hypothetical protein